MHLRTCSISPACSRSPVTKRPDGRRRHLSVTPPAVRHARATTQHRHVLDALDARHHVLEVPLHAVGQRELGHRAAGAGALEAHLHDSVLHVDELDVATVGLQGRADVTESVLDLLLESQSSVVTSSSLAGGRVHQALRRRGSARAANVTVCSSCVRSASTPLQNSWVSHTSSPHGSTRWRHRQSRIGPSTASYTSRTVMSAAGPRQHDAALLAALGAHEVGARQVLDDLGEPRARGCAARAAMSPVCSTVPGS